MTLEELLKKVRAIEILSRRLVKEKLQGDFRSAFRGTGMQFKEFRNYVYGDDVRHISWNVSARTADPVLKVFEEERDRVLMLVVDVSASLRKGPWAHAKAEKLAEVAATLALSAAESRDKFGLILFSDRVERIVPPGKGRTQLLRVIREILAFEPLGTKTSPAVALKRLLTLLKRRSIVVLLSDLEVLPEETLLKRVARNHAFAAIHVEHPHEWTPPKIPCFIEVETAESERPVTLDVSQQSFLDFLGQFGKRRRSTMNKHFRECGATLLHLSTDQDTLPLLRDFFRTAGRGQSPTDSKR